jgi:hypothetical protein
MKALFAALPALSVLCSTPAMAMSCNNQLVNEGQSTYEVMRICGEPQSADRRTIYITEAAGPPAPGAPLVYVQIPVNIDEWIYNFGPTALMQKLTFRNDRLVGVEALGYGN